MEKDLNQLLQIAIQASKDAKSELQAAQEAFDSAEDAKAKDKAEKALIKAQENAAKKEAEEKAAQEAFDSAESNTGKLKGNVDSSYEFEAKDRKAVHVRHSRIEKLPSGAAVEDPGSVRIQMYDVHTFEDQKLNKEKGLPSIWDMGETLKVLHDPTK